ncbi:MAG: hypothetical protein MMC23_001427 [Stictis urceolatum]|nr:hypothetical protein [Stictis urceolata]
MATDSPIRVVIIGGGIAGATLANALQAYPHISAELYESAPEFPDSGLAVGLAMNAQSALKQMLPNADEIIEKSGAVPMKSTRLVLGSGPQTGAQIHDFARSVQGKVVHRAALLRELLAPLPKSILHTSKKLAHIDTFPSGSLTIHFTDLTSLPADILVGTDGINSSVRAHVLEPTGLNPAPTPGGWWDVRTLVPIQRAREALGEEVYQEDRQYGWLGDRAFIMHDIIDGGDRAQIAICWPTAEGESRRKMEVAREVLEAVFEGWEGTGEKVAKGAVELIFEGSKTPIAYSFWEHRDTPSYIRGRTLIMGDAAHSMTPWQGAGAGQAIEDAMVLSALLGQTKNTDHIEDTLKVWNEIRHPRTQKINKSSKVTGQIFTGLMPDVGTNAERMTEELKGKWDFIYGLDLAKYRQEALAMLEKRNS